MNTNVDYRSRRGRKKRQKDGEKCLVCQGQSVGLNFGVLTCAPCKAFFRRNAVKLGSYDFMCDKDGDCPVTGDTRRQCNCCRLAKCFRVGMNRTAIRTEDQKLERNRLIESNRRKKMENSETIQPVNLIRFSNKSYSSLSSNDQTLLKNIFTAYEQTCVSLHYHKYSNMPNNNALSIQSLMNSVSHMYIALIDYFKFIPEFSSLSIETRITLLKTNLNQIFRLNTALIVHATGVSDDASAVVLKRVFPADLYSELCRCVFSLSPFVYDPIFLKLLFIVLIFSTNLTVQYDINQQIIHTGNLLSTQNFYVELLWRYILYRSSSYRQSVKLLTLFITRLLYSQKINEQLSGYISKIATNQTDQLVPIMKAMWLNEKK